MGVPVVSLRGLSHVARVGEGLLERAGLGSLSARSIEVYVSTAVASQKTWIVFHRCVMDCAPEPRNTWQMDLASRAKSKMGTVGCEKIVRQQNIGG